MRKYIILAALLMALVTGCMWWLGQVAVKEPPPGGEVRIPVDGIL